MKIDPDDLYAKLDTEKDAEFRCGSCRARCTRNPIDGTEYGHYTGCPHRPDDFPAGGHYLKNCDHAPGQTTDGEVVADGGTFDCENCGDETPVTERWRYIRPNQDDDEQVQHDELCPGCSTGKDSSRLFRAAGDMGGDGDE
jgi:hypothetical protein